MPHPFASPAARRLVHSLSFRLAALLLAALSPPAEAAVYTVGIGAGCTHADLFSALVAAASSPGLDEIRLLAGSTHQGQFLVNTDGLWLRGGYASCTAATNTGYSTLLGTNSSRALFLNAAGGALLERLNITGGTVTGNGGGLFLQGSSSVVLADVLLFGNHATARGGNLFVSGSPGLALRLVRSTLVASGEAQDGGGLACAGAGIVSLEDGTVVANNVATRHGGGVHLADGCWLRHLAGGAAAGIVSNQAGANGGGAYLEGGADLTTGMDARGLAEISGNAAPNGNGGGVYLVGAGTVLQAFFARLANNQAGSVGGGVAAEGGSYAELGRPSPGNDPCADPARCSLVQGNSAPIGGAIWAAASAVLIHGTHLEGNSATSAGSVAYLFNGASATLSSSVLAGNDGPWPLNVSTGGSTLTLGNVTALSNTAIGPGFIGFSPGSGAVRVLSSIFDQPESQIFTGATTALVQLDCVLSRTAGFLSGLPAGGITRAIAIADPRLRNAAGGDFRLGGTSPAIDFCDTTEWAGSQFDLEWQPRDLDHPLPDRLGPRDLGADEYLVLLRDDFESGATGRWVTHTD